MPKSINRRDFIKTGAVVGASSIMGGKLLPGIFNGTAYANSNVDLAVVKGDNYFNNTVQAVDLLGGMSKFVSKGAKVGLLANSPWKNKGTYTNPDVVFAVIQMCYGAGAGEIVSIEGATNQYWNRGSLIEDFRDEVKSIKDPGGRNVTVQLDKAVHLKEATVCKALLECDVLIDIPVIKDHSGSRFTGCLKNMMGASVYDPTNVFIHFGDTGKSWQDGGYEDVPFLSQSIADLCLVRKPDLCIADATEMIKTNGPGGPGELVTPQSVVAGTDWVAVDSYCTRYLDLKGTDILMLTAAHEHGLGEIDTTQLNISET